MLGKILGAIIKPRYAGMGMGVAQCMKTTHSVAAPEIHIHSVHGDMRIADAVELGKSYVSNERQCTSTEFSNEVLHIQNPDSSVTCSLWVQTTGHAEPNYANYVSKCEICADRDCRRRRL